MKQSRARAEMAFPVAVLSEKKLPQAIFINYYNRLQKSLLIRPGDLEAQIPLIQNIRILFSKFQLVIFGTQLAIATRRLGGWHCLTSN